jgi:F0F1-type ATP synthase delta subunit
MPVSEVLQSLAAENTYNLDQPADRQRLASELMAVSQSAPIVHISLAADPPMSFVVAITSWLRANVHPLVLVRIGLQPSIAAGCIVRTTNKVFDMSLRHRFEQNTNKLIQALSGEAQ